MMMLAFLFFSAAILAHGMVLPSMAGNWLRRRHDYSESGVIVNPSSVEQKWFGEASQALSSDQNSHRLNINLDSYPYVHDSIYGFPDALRVLPPLKLPGVETQEPQPIAQSPSVNDVVEMMENSWTGKQKYESKQFKRLSASSSESDASFDSSYFPLPNYDRNPDAPIFQSPPRYQQRAPRFF